MFSAVANAQPYFSAKGKVYNDSIVARVDILIDPDLLFVIRKNVLSNQDKWAISKLIAVWMLGEIKPKDEAFANA